MSSALRILKKFIPSALFRRVQPYYHYSLALIGAILYRFPSREIKVVAITGTKGKTSTAELVNAVLEEAGFKTALAGTLRFKIDKNSRPNLYKMTMPGRFFVQQFLRQAVTAGCDWAVMEMTSEGAKQFRHKFVDLDALIFTNLAPEHIESHGSYENYLAAKLKYVEALDESRKQHKSAITNIDDIEGGNFLAARVENKLTYSLNDIKNLNLGDKIAFELQGQKFESALKGRFNTYNILAAIRFGESQKIPVEKIRAAIGKVGEIKGRVEAIRAGQKFGVYVDYAHTPDSLSALYGAFSGKKKICVLGNTGGGRDTWKRPEMGSIADKNCEEIILTNEDPYDESPTKIVMEMAYGMNIHRPQIIMDRREAIRQALKLAQKRPDQENVVVLISGKGTDPYIMGPNGTKTLWSDSAVAEEELKRL